MSDRAPAIQTVYNRRWRAKPGNQERHLAYQRQYYADRRDVLNARRAANKRKARAAVSPAVHAETARQKELQRVERTRARLERTVEQLTARARTVGVDTRPHLRRRLNDARKLLARLDAYATRLKAAAIKVDELSFYEHVGQHLDRLT